MQAVGFCETRLTTLYVAVGVSSLNKTQDGVRYASRRRCPTLSFWVVLIRFRAKRRPKLLLRSALDDRPIEAPLPRRRPDAGLRARPQRRKERSARIDRSETKVSGYLAGLKRKRRFQPVEGSPLVVFRLSARSSGAIAVLCLPNCWKCWTQLRARVPGGLRVATGDHPLGSPGCVWEAE